MKYLIVILAALGFVNLSAQIVFEEKEIDKGIIHKKIINTQDTLIINILQIDIISGDYSFQSVKAKNQLNAKETTTEMVKAFNDSAYKVIAGINADFFEADGEIINNMVSNGTIVKAVKFTDSPFNPFVNTQFAVTYDNKLLMDQFVFAGNIILPDGSIEELKRINSVPDSNSISLYNYYQGKFTPEMPKTWSVLEFTLKSIENKGDTLRFTINKISEGGKTQISKDENILSSYNSYTYYLRRELSESDTIGLLLNFNPHNSYQPLIRTLIGGWPRIVTNGKNVIKTNKNVEGIFPEFSETRHPRTGVGFSKDSTKIFFLTVDGRQSNSRGISLEEFADFMISEGVYQGLNLDGGGSTTMVINNEIVNNPSDSTGERKVGNCLILVKRIKDK